MAVARTLYRRSLVALILSVTLVACGGGGEDTIPTAAQDKTQAEKIVLTEADLPDLTREEDDDDPADESDPFRQCLNGNQVLTDLGDGPRSAESTLANDDQTVVRSSAVNLAESEDAAKAAFAVLEGAEFKTCFEDAIRSGFETELGADAELSDLSVSDLTLSGEGDESVGYRTVLSLEAAGQKLPLTIDYVFLRAGRGVAVLLSLDVNTTLEAGERDRLSKILADRMADAT